MKLKFKALALLAMLIAAPAFAAGGSDYTTDLTAGAIDVGGTEVPAAFAVYATSGGAATDSYATNVALIEQMANNGNGNGDNIAVIDQSLGGTGNFAAISQGSALASGGNAVGATAGIAFIQQASNDNFAYITQ